MAIRLDKTISSEITQLIDKIRETAAKTSAGKYTQTFLHFHRVVLENLGIQTDILDTLWTTAGLPDNWNTTRVNTRQYDISLKNYQDFWDVPHPVLGQSLLCTCDQYLAKTRYYDQDKNPPILHRKEQLISPTDPRYRIFQRLTQQEEDAGLLTDLRKVGKREPWLERLQTTGYQIVDHKLVRP
ncbi:MAG: hypothetical protein WCY01_07965 [Alkalispirochaeta sp.]